MLRRRTVVSRLRKLVASAAVLTCAAAAFAGIERPSAAAAPPGLPSDALPAVFAQGGTSRYRDTIQWLQWADYGSNFAGKTKPNVPVLDYGQTKDFVNERDLGDGGTLVTTCTLSNLQHLGHNPATTEAQAKGPLVATIPGAWAGDKPEWDIPVASVGPRLFLLLIPHTDGRLLANVKLDPEDVVAVRAAFEWVEPGFHQSKRHWVSIDLTSPDYRADDAADMVEDSYRLVLSLLTRRMREAVLLADAAGSPARPTWQW